MCEMERDSTLQCGLSVCAGVWALVHVAVWLFVRATCLKTGSLTGRQDVGIWTLGNRATPSEPGLKQDGFVCAIAILPLPSFPPTSTYSTGLQPQAPRTRCSPSPQPHSSSGPAAYRDQKLPQSNLIFTGTEGRPLFNQEAYDISQEPEGGRPADREQHVIPQAISYTIYETFPFLC